MDIEKSLPRTLCHFEGRCFFYDMVGCLLGSLLGALSGAVVDGWALIVVVLLIMHPKTFLHAPHEV